MKVGVLLPTFSPTSEPALAAASEAGLDGVFAYDHLWPMGKPARPALAPFPVLAVVARHHPSLCVGPLVARVGLTGTDHLLAEFASLAAVAPGRVVAALGTGDKLSREENDAYGIPWTSADERRGMVAEAARALADVAEVWIGAGAPATNDVARSLGVTLNVWGLAATEVARLGADGPVSWAGPIREELARTLDDLADAGATWAVCAPDVDLASLANWRARSAQ